jgi:hypothetical protein
MRCSVPKSVKNQLVALVSVMFLFYAGTCWAATTIKWDRGGNSSDWNTAENWDPNGVPANSSSYYAAINMAAGPVVPATSTVNAYRVYLNGSNGTLTVNGGTVNLGNHIYVADVSGSTGTLTINSGTVNIVGTLYVSRDLGSAGYLNLLGGSLTCGTLNPCSGTGNDAHINLEQGTLTYTSTGRTLATYIANGWITAYDGTGTLVIDTTTIPGKTILSAVNQSKAVEPSPANNRIFVDRNITLSWTAGRNATSHNVYLGTTNPPAFVASVTGASFSPAALDFDTTYYWRVDEVGATTITGDVWNFSTVSGQSKNPDPVVGKTLVPINKILNWQPNSFAASHDVYFGTDLSDVTNTARLPGDLNGNGIVDWPDISLLGDYWLVDPAGTEPYAGVNFDNIVDLMDFALLAPDWHNSAGPAFKGNQDASSFNPGALAIETTYYWRVDEVNGPETEKGNVWSFTTQPAKAYSPIPAAAGSGLTDGILNWTAGAGAASHDVYFGTTNPPPFQGNQTSTTFNAGTLPNTATYYWRVDEIGSYGTVTGDVWSFTTVPVNTSPIYQYLSWRSDPTNSIVVNWYDPCSPAGDTTVDYGTTTSYDSSVTNTTSSIFHHVELTGLSPGTTYHYRPRSSNGAVGPDATFTTELASPTIFRFAVYGDERSDQTTLEPFYTRHQQLANWVAAQNFDFVLQGGDTVYVGGSTNSNGPWMWYDYYRLSSNLGKSKVVMATMGNHEVQDAGQDPYLYYDLYTNAFPANGPAIDGKGRVYSFDYGNAHFVSLTSYQVDVTAQAAWLNLDLQIAKANPNIKWIFVFFHAPMYTKTDPGTLRGDRTDEINTWGPLFDLYHVDIAFQSHNHVYERSYSVKNGAVVGDGVGTVYITNGLGGAGFELIGPMHPDLFAASYSAFGTNNSTATCVTITGNNLSVQTITAADQSIRDSFILTKP